MKRITFGDVCKFPFKAAGALLSFTISLPVAVWMTTRMIYITFFAKDKHITKDMLRRLW